MAIIPKWLIKYFSTVLEFSMGDKSGLNTGQFSTSTLLRHAALTALQNEV